MSPEISDRSNRDESYDQEDD